MLQISMPAAWSIMPPGSASRVRRRGHEGAAAPGVGKGFPGIDIDSSFEPHQALGADDGHFEFIHGDAEGSIITDSEGRYLSVALVDLELWRP